MGAIRRPASNAFWAAIVVGELIRLPSRPGTRRTAIGKLVRERRHLVSGQPATHPFTGVRPAAAPLVPHRSAEFSDLTDE